MSSNSCDRVLLLSSSSGSGAASANGSSGQLQHPNLAADDVDHVSLLSSDLGRNLYLSVEYADVYLLVGGVKFPSHKILLAARSDYFRALLYGGMRESSQTEIVLNGPATTAAFKVLLKYVYTGRLALGELKEDTILDVLGLSHQWGFQELEDAICTYLHCALHVGNVCAILDTAITYGLEALVDTCAVFADANTSALLQHPSFLNLSPSGVVELISRDSFCAGEETIFDSVSTWVRHNKEVHGDSGAADQVLSAVRLPLMNINTLLTVVRPTNLVSPDSILDAIEAQKKAPRGGGGGGDNNSNNNNELRYRGYLVPEENVAHVKHGAVVLKGEMRQALLDGDVSNYDVERGFTRHVIDDLDTNSTSSAAAAGATAGAAVGSGNNCIVVKLRQQCILNHLRMLLWDRDLRSYSYYVEVSMNHDQDDWVRVCDHTRYHCRSWQNIYFPKRVVRYIKLVGTHNSVNRMFHVVQLEAYYTNKPFALHPKLGLLCPSVNVATIEMSGCVIEGVSRSRNALINGETRGYDWDSGYTCHQLGSGAIVVQLAQPYVVSSMRLLLWDCDDRSYSYYIEVSTNQRNWEMVANRSRDKCKSWQVIQFNPTPVVYVRIVGTDNTANEVFHCVHFECPSQQQQQQQVVEVTSVAAKGGDDHVVVGGGAAGSSVVESSSSADASGGGGGGGVDKKKVTTTTTSSSSSKRSGSGSVVVGSAAPTTTLCGSGGVRTEEEGEEMPPQPPNKVEVGANNRDDGGGVAHEGGGGGGHEGGSGDVVVVGVDDDEAVVTEAVGETPPQSLGSPPLTNEEQVLAESV